MSIENTCDCNEVSTQNTSRHDLNKEMTELSRIVLVPLCPAQIMSAQYVVAQKLQSEKSCAQRRNTRICNYSVTKEHYGLEVKMEQNITKSKNQI